MKWMKAMAQGESNKALGLLCCYQVLTLSGKVVQCYLEVDLD